MNILKNENNTFNLKRLITQKSITVVAILVLVTAVTTTYRTEQKELISSEIHFADRSNHGLLVVPASCPSSPHYAGECTLPITCPLGTVWDGIMCLSTKCGTGLTWNGATCVSVTCPVNSVWNGTSCITNTCPIGSIFNGSTCVVSSCPTGSKLDNGHCVTADCGSGQVLVSGICTNSTCISQNLCNSTDGNVYHQNSDCSLSVIRPTCQWGCNSGVCSTAPMPSVISWSVKPTLIRIGGSVTVTWNVIHAASCTVTSNGGDYQSGLSGTFISGAIKNQRTFLLRCIPLAGSSGTIDTPNWNDQIITVNIAPTFRER